MSQHNNLPHPSLSLSLSLAVSNIDGVTQIHAQNTNTKLTTNLSFLKKHTNLLYETTIFILQL